MNRDIILCQRFNKWDNFGGFRFCEYCGGSFRPNRGFQQPTPTICPACKIKLMEGVKE